MKLLVFGKTGQVARALAEQVAAKPALQAVFLDRAGADLADPAACAAAIHARRPDLVLNAAAFTDVEGAEMQEALAHVINADAPAAMAGAAADLDVPFLHLSSDYVFDGTGTAAWRPDAAPAPLGAYGRSKLAGEAAVRAAGGRQLILRTSWVFSAQGRNFVTSMLRLSRTHARLDVVADQIGGPTAADDIAAALLQLGAAMQAGAAGGTYHFAGQPATSWADFARAIFRLAGRPTQVRDIASADYPTRAPRPLNSRLDCSSLTSDFAITPPQWQPALARVLGRIAGQGTGQGTG